MPSPLESLRQTLPQLGRLVWIGLRPTRGAPMRAVTDAFITLDGGLEGDRFAGRPGSRRQITLIQAEHLAVVSALLGKPIEPELLRRNLVVEGINLLALKDQCFRIGDVMLEGTGTCAPCSKMEAALGPGGFNALRGHGGLCARVRIAGAIHLGDAVSLQTNTR
ncbi:MOSC domain-containing protein [Halomonas denitrificans]|nr:MOSC domain-containing protein [Halomonas denitrificans]